MSPVSFMPYAVIAGVVLVSVLAGFLVGWDDAWFVPVVVIPLALFYAAFDRAQAKRRESSTGG